MIDEYLREICKLANQLAAMASPIHDTDQSYFTLGGLGPEYESFITTLSLQADDLPLEDLWCLLRSHEVSFFPSHRCSCCHGPCCRQTSLAASSSQSTRPHSDSWTRTWKGTWSRFPFTRSSFPGSTSAPSSQGKHQCQICSKPGHLAIDCYIRLNMSDQGRNPSRQLAAMHINADPSHE